MKFIAAEQDTIGPRITVSKIEVEFEVADFEDGTKWCRTFLTWGAQNNGPATGKITKPEFILREYPAASSGTPPYVESADDGKEVLKFELPKPRSPLRPGSVHQWSRIVVFPYSPNRYLAEANVYVEGEPNPWTTGATLRCYSAPSSPLPSTVNSGS